MNFDAWTYHPDRLPQEYNEKRTALEALEKEFVQQLQADPTVQEWLAWFRAEDREGFLKTHAHWKRNLVEYFKYHYADLTAEPELRFREYGQFCLEAIQSKKLFNLQLLWRADEVKVEGLQLCCQFDDWRSKPLECPFIDPVTPEEIRLMQDFLATEEGEDFVCQKDASFAWRDLQEMRNENTAEAEELYPAWYTYYDRLYGTGSLLLLPDIRGGKEAYYMELGRESRKAAPAATPPPTPSTYLPLLFYSTKQNEFVAKFEDRWFQALFEHLDRKSRAEEDAEAHHDIEEYLRLLRLCAHTIPMPPLNDWREALRRCAHGSLAQQVSGELEEVYAEYSLLNELKIGNADEYWDDYSLFDMYKKCILEGRKAAGEPETLDF